MDTFINLIKINLIFSVLYLLYKWLLEKETFFQWNRFFLLMAIPFSIALGTYRPGPIVLDTAIS